MGDFATLGINGKFVNPADPAIGRFDANACGSTGGTATGDSARGPAVANYARLRVGSRALTNLRRSSTDGLSAPIAI